MIERRHWIDAVGLRLQRFPVVAIVGSRQAGKTTLAAAIARRRKGHSVRLDLESPRDRAKLVDPEAFLASHARDLVVLDEIQRMPGLFEVLRSVVDADRRPGRFLVLGSASPALLAQTSESLAGRIAYVDLPPISLLEFDPQGGMARRRDRLWVRGGYPKSLLASSDEESLEWRHEFVRTYLERDLPQLGVRVPAEQLRRFWMMLAHWHGQVWNASRIASSLGVTVQTTQRWLDLLVDACLVRRLEPWHANLGKRLVKSPKVYVRDSGVLHALLGVTDRDRLFGHPSAGASFEGFVVEQAVSRLGRLADATYYRTQTGVEMDLILSVPGRCRIGIEVKLSTAPKIGRGTREAVKDTGCDAVYCVFPSGDPFPMGGGVEALPLDRFLRDVIEPLAQDKPRRGRAR